MYFGTKNKKMELTFDKNKDLSTTKKSKYWNDSLVQDFYLNYYHSLNSKELDEEFSKDIKLLTDTLVKLPTSERKIFIQVLSSFIEFYLENKIEREIDGSLLKILKF